MVGVAGSYTADPVIGLIAAAILLAVLGGAALVNITREKAPADPLADLFKRETFEDQVHVVAERRQRRRPPIHGQRAQMRRLREVWGQESRAEAIEEIARVMRASKDAAPAPVRVLEETSDVPATDWEEIRLLPPPSEAKDSKAA